VVRDAAGARLQRNLERQRYTGDAPSEAVQNAHRILEQGGLPALFAALDRKEFLPGVLFALGLAPLYQSASRDD
jgi:hypothetical protein